MFDECQQLVWSPVTCCEEPSRKERKNEIVRTIEAVQRNTRLVRVYIRVKVGKCYDLVAGRWATAGTLIRGGFWQQMTRGAEGTGGLLARGGQWQNRYGQLVAGAAFEAFRATGAHRDGC